MVLTRFPLLTAYELCMAARPVGIFAAKIRQNPLQECQSR